MCNNRIFKYIILYSNTSYNKPKKKKKHVRPGKYFKYGFLKKKKVTFIDMQMSNIIYIAKRIPA